MTDLLSCFIVLVLIILVIYLGIRRKEAVRIKKLKSLNEEFGSKIIKKPDMKIDTDCISGYLKYLKDKSESGLFILDDITYNDLNLKDIYINLNRCLSSIGEEYLFARINTLYAEPKKAKDFYHRLNEIIKDDNKRQRIQEQLLDLGKLKGIDSFDVLAGLKKAKALSIVKDIILDIILIASFTSIFIIPGPGLLAFIICLAFAIVSYFQSRSRMEESLAGFSYLVKTIRTGFRIEKICSEDLVDKELLKLTKLNILLPLKRGTSSDPLSLLLDYVRMIFHVDIILYSYQIEKVGKQWDAILSLYEKLGELDAVISVASYSLSFENICQPEYILDGRSCLEAEDMYHPLIDNPIGNDIRIDSGMLITGSNASGKSTFLKTVGINVIFAQSFGFAFAKKLVISPFKLYTSMALNDNLLGHESYYIVETKSLKRIIDAAKVSSNILCIIDEVLRGTNTIERIAASSVILEHLSKCGVLTIVATHDSELADILEKDYVLKYFSEEIIDNNIVFPFKIKSGIASDTNAIKLLSVLGYDRAITDEAQKMVNNYKNIGKW